LPGTFLDGLPPLLTKAFGFTPEPKEGKDDPLTKVARELQNELTAAFINNRRHIYSVSASHEWP